MIEKRGRGRSVLHWHGWIGLAIIGISEALLFAGVGFVKTFFTPLVWSGYILLADSLVYRRKGRSLMMNRPGEFLLLLPLSVGFWLIFEFYNLYLRNWHYAGLPEELPFRLLGYGWAFATIWPAILETAEVLESWAGISTKRVCPWKVKKRHLVFSLIFGTFCLVIPLIVSSRAAHYLAAPVWLGFIFLLDPINYWRGGDSLFGDLMKGSPRRLYSLLLSGVLCGFLWEFWNYWAGARWDYAVPLWGHIKVFEMPALGYLGFPPFALECFTMVSLLRKGILPEGVPNG